MAKILWSAIAKLAQHELYLFTPEVFALAAEQTDPQVFEGDLKRLLARKYEEPTQTEAELANFAAAVRFFTEALSYEPQREVSLRTGPGPRVPPANIDLAVHCSHNLMIINLDHNATTAIHPEVVQAMADVIWPARQRGQFASARAAGTAGVGGSRRDRPIVGADVTGPQPDRILLTSGGTEANNLALFGMAGPRPGRMIISSVEHSSVSSPAEQLERQGFEVCRVRVDSSGVIDESHFASCSRRRRGW